ncbi:NADH dehydrogenase (ubiquinone) complex I, assembly factor 6 [Podochytrium sp. JEL0797]|nr:NADH dehydrogenase (ubiquinone) complex I, assembly factor 6 [Podochytrium sp. JEL0797]
MASFHKHCLDAVRTSDWEGYMTTLFVPSPQARNFVFGLRAFNAEVAVVGDQVRQNRSLAAMRFKFWRDLVDGVYEQRPLNHHVAQSLAEAVQTTPLSKSFLHRIINAREKDFNENSFYPTSNALENYAEQTQSSLLYLQLEACGVQNFKVDHIASHIGKAIGIATVLRATPIHVPQRQIYLPGDLMAKHNLSSEDVFRSGASESLADVVFDLATLADNHLATARAEIQELQKTSGAFPDVAIPALLPFVTFDSYLKRLEAVDFNVFDARLRKRDWRLLYSLWVRNRRGEL